MALNEIFRDGDHLAIAVDDDVKSGDVVVVGDIAGVAQIDYDAKDGKSTVWFSGVFEIPVANGTYTVGQPIYGHATGGGNPVSGEAVPLVNGTATTGVKIGNAIEAKTTTGGTGVLRVRLSA